MLVRRLTTLTLALGLALGMLAGPSAKPANAASLKICGEVNVYVKSTLVATGLLKVGSVPFVVAAGVNLPASVLVGADLCFDLTTGPGGIITGAVVSANVHTKVSLCGEVAAYVKATSSATGLLKIGGRTFTLGVGAVLPAAVKVGADLCLDLTLDGFGRVSYGDVQANATATVRICGQVQAYAAATLTSTGSLKIAGRTFVLGSQSDLPASVHVGANLCLTLTLNALAQVQDGIATANVTTSLKVCGVVTSYAAATLSQTGLLKIAGHSLVTGLGVNLPAVVKAGADLCLDLDINVFGQVSGGGAVVNATAVLTVCGQVTAYAKATATTNGSITIGGVNRTIAAGADVAASVKLNAYLRLRLDVNAFAWVTDVTVLKIGVSVSDACGGATPSPSPTPSPTPTTAPTGSPAPTDSSAPSSSPVPTATPTGSVDPSVEPSPSDDPSASPDPSDEPSPSPSTEPSGGVAPVQDTCDPDDLTGGSATTGNGFLPDTASLARTAGVVVGNAIPLLLVGSVGLLFGWFVSRRRSRDFAADAELALPAPANAVATSDPEQVG